uniref:Uncharacterized protein n=1 Tax=Sphaerodactylus townsendi TaxID=933632 RepID=A0ACB8ELQ3_9SAUR
MQTRELGGCTEDATTGPCVNAISHLNYIKKGFSVLRAYKVNLVPQDNREILDLRVYLVLKVLLGFQATRVHQENLEFQDWLVWMDPQVTQEEKDHLVRKEPR